MATNRTPSGELGEQTKRKGKYQVEEQSTGRPEGAVYETKRTFTYWRPLDRGKTRRKQKVVSRFPRLLSPNHPAPLSDAGTGENEEGAVRSLREV